ncbi:MAG: FtsX-like permease family protein [Promethearchaeia archaeon]
MIKAIASIGFKNAKRRKTTSFLTILAVALAVSLTYTAISSTGRLMVSANQFMQQSLSPVDITVSSTKWGSPITNSMRDSVQALPNTAQAIPRIEEIASYENESSVISLFLVGIDPQQERHIGSLNVTEGTNSLVEDNCFVTTETMELLNLSLGQELRLDTTAGHQFFNVSGYGLAIDKGVIGPAVFIPLDSAWEIYTIRYPDHSVNKLLVEVHDVFGTPETVSAAEDMLGEDYVVTNLKAYHLRIANLFLSQANTILLALVGAAAFVAAFRVFSSFSMLFSQRKRESGVVLAFGGSRDDLLSILLSEVGIIGLVGSLLGGAVGVILSRIILELLVATSRIIYLAPTAAFFGGASSMSLSGLLASGAFGVGLTVFSGFVPAWQSSKESIASNLGKGTVQTSTGSSSMGVSISDRVQKIMYCISVPLCILVVVQVSSDLLNLSLLSSDIIRIGSVPILLFGVVAISPKLAGLQPILKPLTYQAREVVRVLSQRNLRRNTMVAMVVFNLFAAATTLLIASSNVGYAVTASWERSLGAGVSSANIIGYADPPADRPMVDTIQSMPEVDQTVPVNQRVTEIHFNEESGMGVLLGTHPAEFEGLASIGLLQTINESQGLKILQEPRSCVISEYTARERNLDLGDNITVGTLGNTTVVGIAGSSVPFFVLTILTPNFVIVSNVTWSSLVGEEFQAGSILIRSDDPAQTMNALAEFPSIRSILISNIEADYEGALNAIQTTIDASILTLVVTTILSALIGSWAISSTRIREIGLLASMGMSDSEIAWSIAAESSVAIITGVLVGSVVGLVVQSCLHAIMERFVSAPMMMLDPKIAVLLIVSIFLSTGLTYRSVKSTAKQHPANLLAGRQARKR